MTPQERVAEQTRIRHKLLDNGYSPLPLLNKMCFEKGWNTLQPTHDMVDKWGRKAASQTTGVRIDGRLIALDFDIDNGELMDAIADRAFEINPAFDQMPARFGGGTHKQTWFARLDDESAVWKKYRTKTYVDPAHDPSDEAAPHHALELFSAGSAVQCGVYGVHTPGDSRDAEPKRRYRWDEVDGRPFDLLHTPLNALPVVTRAQIEELVDLVHTTAEELGFQQVRSIPSGPGCGGDSYDLTPDMVFRCADGRDRSFEELREYAATDWSARCDASFLDPASINRDRCSIRISHEGKLFVYDFMTYTRHFHFGERDKTLSELGAMIRDRVIANRFMTPEEAEAATASSRDKFDEALGICHATYAVDPAANGGRGGFLRLDGRRERDLTPAGLRLKFAPFSLVAEGKRGGVKRYNPADAYVIDPKRPTANGYRFLPDEPAGLVSTADGTYVNTHIPPDRSLGADWPEQQQLFLDFMAHLIPMDEERNWFLDRLAHKAQNLGVPGVTTIITTRKEGTGRNTLFDMLAAAFGHSYVDTVPAEDILGTGLQAHFNDWMCDKHFVCCSELLGDHGDTMSTRGKTRVLEHMKERMEPAPMFHKVNFKGAANQREWITTSYILATNHLDALPLDAGSRRFTVLRGAKEALIDKPDLAARVHAQRLRGSGPFSPTFGAALWKLLSTRDIGSFDGQAPADFGGREAMAAASKDELDDLVEQVLDANPYGWGAVGHLVDQVQRANSRREFSIDGNPVWHRKSIQARIRALWPASHEKRIRIGGGQAFVAARNEETLQRVFDMPGEQRAEEAAWSFGTTVATPAALRAVK